MIEKYSQGSVYVYVKLISAAAQLINSWKALQVSVVSGKVLPGCKIERWMNIGRQNTGLHRTCRCSVPRSTRNANYSACFKYLLCPITGRIPVEAHPHSGQSKLLSLSRSGFAVLSQHSSSFACVVARNLCPIFIEYPF